MLTVRDVFRELEFGLVSGASALFEAAARFFVRLETNLIEEKKRDDVRGLLKLDDHQLQDMGITRDDVRSALMQPLDVNSGRKLSIARKQRV